MKIRIAYGSYNREVQIRHLARRLTLSDSASYYDPDELWYLGGGYWRLREHPDGFELINPDRTEDELILITAALNILGR